MKSQIEFTDQENQAERTHVAVRDGFCSSGDAYRGCGLLRPAYGEVKDSVAEGDVIYVDETEFPVNSKQYWVWTFVTEDKLLHTVDQNRGSQVLGDVLGEETGIAVKTSLPVNVISAIKLIDILISPRNTFFVLVILSRTERSWSPRRTAVSLYILMMSWTWLSWWPNSWSGKTTGSPPTPQRAPPPGM